MTSVVPERLARLAGMDLPGDLPSLSLEEKEALAQDVRDAIIAVVSENGGHLAASLGVVELTIALLSVFDPGRDAIVWDVGHQCYPWKLLTGRAAEFDTLRCAGGLSGFPRREESPYDPFGVGHASTSISAALGMAVARDLRGNGEHVVAVIGDGALTGGMALEALNQAGGLDKRLIVILNDNAMAISENVGALSRFLSRSLANNTIMGLKQAVGRRLRAIPKVGSGLVSAIHRGETSFKSFFTPGIMFEAMHFNYIGPVNGHDIPQLVRHLETAKKLDMPVLLHVRTRKGKGYAPAEANPSRFHGVTAFEPETGCSRPAPPSDEFGPGFSSTLGDTLCELAQVDPRVMVITAAMPDGTGTSCFQRLFPDRFVDVGICEEHAVTFAAGLATRGFRPVVAIYSTFLQRALDQIIHDVALQKLPVIFCLDRAGLVGEDGPTHHGAFDLSWLRCVPGLNLMAPRDEDELRHGLYTALSLPGPTALRYPRGSTRLLEPHPARYAPFRLLTPGEGEWLLEGDAPLCVLSAGSRSLPCVEAALRVGKKLASPSVFDARWVKPLPEAQILDIAARFPSLLLVEENSRIGGFSSAVLECLADNGRLGSCAVRRLGLPDRFIPHGPAAALRAAVDLNVDGIARAMEEMLASASASTTRPGCVI